MTLAVRLTALQALNATQRAVVRWLAARIELHSIDCRYTAPGGNVWVCSDDHRLDLTDVAVFGWVAVSLPALANITPQAEGPALRAQIRALANSHVVLPAQIDYTGSTDVYATTLTANGAPASVRAFDRVPDNWVPV